MAYDYPDAACAARQSIICLVISRRTLCQPAERDALKKASVLIAIGFFIIASVLTGLYLNLRHYGATPAETEPAETFVVIPPGQGLRTTAERLHDAGLIRHPLQFRMLARLNRDDKRIQAGEYLFSPSFPPSKILQMMVDGKVYLHKLTVPEGYTLRQIAKLVAQENLADESEFLKTAASSALLKEMGIEADTLEGYLFPDTYHFPRKVPPEKIIATMVQKFWEVFRPQWKERCHELGFSVHEIVTLASIIEKETGMPGERPIISSVFHNRLKKGMRLESDPTVIYRIKGFKGNLTRKHLDARDPYNTYQNKGLPPGPIASPGLESLKAALYPADTKYLYFVSKNDKTHHFSANLDEHNRAVRKYQLHH